MKKAIILHGWESNPTEHWYQGEKTILESKGYAVFVPALPNTNYPQLNEWLSVVENLDPDSETILIGHSLGVPTILRYLEKADKKIDKAILIAGFAQDLGYVETKNFVDRPFLWKKIKSMATEFVIINQKEDVWVPIEMGREIADKLNVALIEVDGTNHFDTMDLDLINRHL